MSTGKVETPHPIVVNVRAYGVLWRIVIGTLVTVSRASLPAILLLALLATDPPITPPLLIRLVAVLALFPALAAFAMQRAFVTEVEIREADLLLHRRDLRVAIPSVSIDRVLPWALPLPGPGLWLRMGSGRRLRYGLQAPDPVPLLAALADAGGVDAARGALCHPAVVYAHAQASAPPWRSHHLFVKYVAFGLAPTAVLFNAHQHIAYGGSLGQYYTYGLGPYLATFGVYWVTVTIYLVLYASAWRGIAEGVALAAAAVAPSRAARVRRAVEAACRVLYYAGVPALLALRFLS